MHLPPNDSTSVTMESSQHPAPVKRLDSAISVTTPEQSPAPMSPTTDLHKGTAQDGKAAVPEQPAAEPVLPDTQSSSHPVLAHVPDTPSISEIPASAPAPAPAELAALNISSHEHTSEPIKATSDTNNEESSSVLKAEPAASTGSEPPTQTQTHTVAATSSHPLLAVPHTSGSTSRSERPLSTYQALPTERLPVPVEHLPPQAQGSSSADNGTKTTKLDEIVPKASATNETSSDYDPEEALDREALTQAGQGAITVDDSASDLGYESDSRSTASTSLASSVRDYAFENGRRYHKFREGRYNFPNDDLEQEREDMKHAMMKLLCQGKLHFAPIGASPHEILDVGTGTGLWAMEMGDDFPSANVLGVDLSPIQPDWVPANVRFMVDDVESPWLWQRNFFDYVHTRHVVQGIKDWPKLMRRTYEHLKPGGWMECQEIYHYPISSNGSMTENHPIAQFWALVYQGLLVQGIDFLGNTAGSVLADRMRDAGFVNITHRVLRIPLGTWPKNSVLKTTGNYWRHILLNGCNAIAMGPLTRGCGWSRQEVEGFLVDVRKAYWDNSPLMYFPLNIVYGQKPESAT